MDHGFDRHDQLFSPVVILWTFLFYDFRVYTLFVLGVLAAAIPVAFLNPSLGFRKRRSVEEGEEEILEKLRFAQRGFKEGEEVFNR